MIYTQYKLTGLGFSKAHVQTQFDKIFEFNFETKPDKCVNSWIILLGLQVPKTVTN